MAFLKPVVRVQLEIINHESLLKHFIIRLKTLQLRITNNKLKFCIILLD